MIVWWIVSTHFNGVGDHMLRLADSGGAARLGQLKVRFVGIPSLPEGSFQDILSTLSSGMDSRQLASPIKCNPDYEVSFISPNSHAALDKITCWLEHTTSNSQTKFSKVWAVLDFSRSVWGTFSNLEQSQDSFAIIGKEYGISSKPWVTREWTNCPWIPWTICNWWCFSSDLIPYGGVFERYADRLWTVTDSLCNTWTVRPPSSPSLGVFLKWRYRGAPKEIWMKDVLERCPNILFISSISHLCNIKFNLIMM